MKGLGIMLLVVALMFASLFAFGNVNQYEIETDLTADALMFSLAEETVEARGASAVNLLAYTELAIAISNNDKEASILIIPNYNSGALMEVNPANSQGLGGVAARLKFPLMNVL